MGLASPNEEWAIPHQESAFPKEEQAIPYSGLASPNEEKPIPHWGLTPLMRQNSVDRRILQRIVRGVRAVRQTLHGVNGDPKLDFLQIGFAKCVFFSPVAPSIEIERSFFQPGDRLEALSRGAAILFRPFVDNAAPSLGQVDVR